VIALLSDGKKHQFWLDPALGHAVRRHEVWTDSGALVVASENSDFVKLTDPEIWLPRHCRAEWHTWPWVNEKGPPIREIALVVDIQAKQLKRVRVPPERFMLKYDKPGSLISDARLPGADKSERGRIEYIVPADPGNLKEAIQAAQEGPSYVPPRRNLLLWALLGILALGAAAGAMALLHRLKGRGATS
jgi:hypothetical protein